MITVNVTHCVQISVCGEKSNDGRLPRDPEEKIFKLRSWLHEQKIYPAVRGAGMSGGGRYVGFNRREDVQRILAKCVELGIVETPEDR